MRQSQTIVREHDGERPVVMETPVLGSGICGIHAARNVRCARMFSERRRDDFVSVYASRLLCH